jgi:hypothetical protein
MLALSTISDGSRRSVTLLLPVLAVALASCGGSSSTSGAGQQRKPSTAAPADDSRPRAPRSTAKQSGIETFGRAAGTQDRAAISAALRAYSLALAADDGAAACSKLSTGVRGQALAVPMGGRRRKSTSCARVLTTLFAREPAQARAAQRAITVTAIRVEGDRGFALFRQPGMPPGFFPMVRERGEWKVGAIGGTVLPVDGK